MKIVVNKCFGGFSLSPKVMNRYYELNGIQCYHFKDNHSKGMHDKQYIPVENDYNEVFVTSFSVPNPNDFEQKELWDKYFLTSRPENRADPLLIQAIEEIGERESSGAFAKLKIIEIPDDISWEIDEYDGVESIHEIHRSW